jgi:hypothetical protein
MSCVYNHVIRKHEKRIYEASVLRNCDEVWRKFISDFARGEIIIKSSSETREMLDLAVAAFVLEKPSFQPGQSSRSGQSTKDDEISPR